MDNSRKNAQNVISMTKFQPDTGYAAIAQVEAYWEAVRGTRLLPKRSDIDPRGIEQALENAFVLERIAPGIARLRIAGSHLTSLMGMEVRGMPLTSFFTPASRSTISEQLEVVFQKPAVCTMDLLSPATTGRPAMEARMILLPLKSDLGDVSRVLGCFVTKGEPGLAPRRFDVVNSTELVIAAGQPATPAPAPTPERRKTPPPPPLPQADAPFQAGMAEDAPLFKPKRQEAPQSDKRRPPYLRLVKSDD